jgi:hypothetical protein
MSQSGGTAGVVPNYACMRSCILVPGPIISSPLFRTAGDHWRAIRPFNFVERQERLGARTASGTGRTLGVPGCGIFLPLCYWPEVESRWGYWPRLGRSILQNVLALAHDKG